MQSSELAKRGVRPARNALGQMTVIMLSSTIRPNPFRDVYQRLTARNMRPAAALGHVAGKLSVVLYGMLLSMPPSHERKHREQLGLGTAADQTSDAPVEIDLEFVDCVDSDMDLVEDRTDKRRSSDPPVALANSFVNLLTYRRHSTRTVLRSATGEPQSGSRLNLARCSPDDRKRKDAFYATSIRDRHEHGRRGR
jgi:hypothetical protein